VHELREGGISVRAGRRGSGWHRACQRIRKTADAAVLVAGPEAVEERVQVGELQIATLEIGALAQKIIRGLAAARQGYI
jgi:hypothetical protein